MMPDTPITPRWWLLRHAAPLVQEGICYGQLDVSADIEGTHHAALNFTRFVLSRHGAHGGTRLRILASPLQRCLQLARAVQRNLLQEGMDCQLDTDERLMEMDFGEWEGQPWDNVSRKEWNDWMADFAGYEVGRRGESLTQMIARIRAMQLAQNPPAEGEWIVWVTHAGVMKALELLGQGMDASDITSPRQWPQTSCSYGQWLAAPLSLGATPA